MFQFNLKYFIITLILLIVEILIATVFSGQLFLRSYFGDVIATIILYTMIRSFFIIQNKMKLAIGVFVFSVFIEVLQFFKTAEFLGFQEGSIPYIMLGNSFSWVDVLCYGVGAILVFLMDQKRTCTENSF